MTGNMCRKFWFVMMFASSATFAELAEDEQDAGVAEDEIYISIVIDDIGDRLSNGLRAVELPANVTMAFLPGSPYSHRLAEKAHQLGKEVMLHQPMEAMHYNAMGENGLSLHMTREAFRETLNHSLESIPHVRGVSNHMGSLLTRHPGHMSWLMEEIGTNEGLFFLDSKTTPETVARRVALEHDVPTISRDIFLDNDRDPERIAEQFKRLIDKAKKRGGWALGIGHPYPETLAILEAVLPTLKYNGIKLVPVSELIATRTALRNKLWHVSLSPSLKAAKNSKQ